MRATCVGHRALLKAVVQDPYSVYLWMPLSIEKREYIEYVEDFSSPRPVSEIYCFCSHSIDFTCSHSPPPDAVEWRYVVPTIFHKIMKKIL